jgi:WD40 repeat protein
MAGFGAAALFALLLAVGAMLANAEAQRQRNEAASQTGIAEENLETAQTNEARAVVSESEAAENLAIAEAEREVSAAQTLVASAAAVVDDDPELALLLATVGATKLEGDVAAQAVLREAMSSARTLFSYPWTADADVRGVWGDLNGDGSRLAVGGDPSGTFVMVDVDSGEEMWRFAPSPAEAERTYTEAEFVFGDEFVIVNLGPMFWHDQGANPVDGLGLYLLDTESGEVERFFDLGMCGGLLSIHGSADEFALIAATSPGYIEQNGCANNDANTRPVDTIRLDLNTGETLTIQDNRTELEGDGSVRLREDGRTAFVHSKDDQIQVIDLETGEVLMSVDDVSEDDTTSAALSPDGALVVYGGAGGSGGERTLKVRDIATGDLVATIAGHAGGNLPALFTADSELLITGGSDGAVRVWNPYIGLQVDVFTGAGAGIADVGISDDGGRIAGFSGDGVTRVYTRRSRDLGTGVSYEACEEEDGGSFYATQGITVRAGRLLVYAYCPDVPAVRVMDMASGETIQLFGNLVSQNQDLSPDGTLVAGQELVSDPDADDPFIDPFVGTILVVNIETDEVVRMEGLCTWRDADGDGPGCGSPPDPYVVYAWDLDFSPDGSMLGLGMWWGASGQVWDPATGESLSLLPADSIELSPDSSRVLSTDHEAGTIELRDTSDWSVVASVPLGADIGLKMHRFTPDGTRIVSAILAGFGAGDIIFRDGDTLEELRRIVAPHEAGVRDLDLSSDGKLIATAGQAGFVKIWDFETGALVHDILIGNDVRVQAVVFINGDTELLVTTASGPVIVVPLEPARVLAAARVRINRGFTDFECDLYFADGACPTLEEVKAG